MNFRRPTAPGLAQMALGGEVLYDPGHPLSDEELARRIKRALRNVGWERADPAAPTRPSEPTSASEPAGHAG